VTDPAIYGFTNTVVLNDTLGVLEVLVVNNDAGSHPFHIHGHNAQIVAQGPPGTPTKPSVWDGTYATAPAKRDVFMVYANSYSIIRFTTGKMYNQ
jgi:iron transport multicopper oxidase